MMMPSAPNARRRVTGVPKVPHTKTPGNYNGKWAIAKKTEQQDPTHRTHKRTCTDTQTHPHTQITCTCTHTRTHHQVNYRSTVALQQKPVHAAAVNHTDELLLDGVRSHALADCNELAPEHPWVRLVHGDGAHRDGGHLLVAVAVVHDAVAHQGGHALPQG